MKIFHIFAKAKIYHIRRSRIYQIPLAEYIVCVANIAFANGKYIAFGEAEYI